MENKYIFIKFGNKDKTEINLPVDKNGILEIEQYIHVGIGKHNFGDVCLSSADLSSDSQTDGWERWCLGKAKIKIDMSEIETEIDVRGVLIKGIERKIKDEMARHEKDMNYFEKQLSQLKAIEYKGDK